MKQRRRIYDSAEQRAEIWEHWKREDSVKSIGRLFDQGSSSIFAVLAPTGGIRPTPSPRALSRSCCYARVGDATHLDPRGNYNSRTRNTVGSEAV